MKLSHPADFLSGQIFNFPPKLIGQAEAEISKLKEEVAKLEEKLKVLQSQGNLVTVIKITFVISDNVGLGLGHEP